MTQTQDVIEREIRIAARPETIFSFFTDPEKMIRWKGISASLDPKPGGIYRIQISDTIVVEGEYVEVTPYTRVVFSWGWDKDNEVLPAGSSTVEISLVEDGYDTIVYLRHEGLPETVRQAHILGWDRFLPQLIQAAQGGDEAASG